MKTKLSDTLTREQDLKLSECTVQVPADIPKLVSSGLFIVTGPNGQVGVGRSPRLALEALEAKTP